MIEKQMQTKEGMASHPPCAAALLSKKPTKKEANNISAWQGMYICFLPFVQFPPRLTHSSAAASPTNRATRACVKTLKTAHVNTPPHKLSAKANRHE